jgi:Protein of unknown function (DUF1153)
VRQDIATSDLAHRQRDKMAEPSLGDSVQQRLNINDGLPPMHPQRWYPRHKALVVSAVGRGTISFQWACDRYAPSAEELIDWQLAFEAHGISGLQVTGRLRC